MKVFKHLIGEKIRFKVLLNVKVLDLGISIITDIRAMYYILLRGTDKKTTLSDGF
jgi:hypothetical protein